jgi:3-methyladenine DNA glycosylase AlkD
MKSKEARELGDRIVAQMEAGDNEAAYSLLAPLLAEKIAFSKLDLIGEIVGAAPVEAVNVLHRRICEDGTMGGWVVIGKGQGQQLDRDLPGTLDRCRTCIIASDVWFGSDILAERVPGPALVLKLNPTLTYMKLWRTDENVWIRRAVGVALHYWAKRSDGDEALLPQAEMLLEFIEPMFSEDKTSAIKGIGWGLKSLGKHYPDLVFNWLADRIIPSGIPYRSLMLRKTLTFLKDSQRAQIRAVNR